MRSWTAVSLASALALGAGCSSNSNPAKEPQDVQGTSSFAAQTPVPNEPDPWDSAWEEVQSGARKSAEAGPWIVEKTDDGAITIYPQSKKVAGKGNTELSDAAILSEVKTGFAADPEVDTEDLNVDVADGAVTLRGQVDSPTEERLAVSIALNSKGVERVTSYLK